MSRDTGVRESRSSGACQAGALPCHRSRMSGAFSVPRKSCQNDPMAAFAPIEWHDLFLGAVGASAALTGLLFVAISINLEQILSSPIFRHALREPSASW